MHDLINEGDFPGVDMDEWTQPDRGMWGVSTKRAPDPPSLFFIIV